MLDIPRYPPAFPGGCEIVKASSGRFAALTTDCDPKTKENNVTTDRRTFRAFECMFSLYFLLNPAGHVAVVTTFVVFPLTQVSFFGIAFTGGAT